jgi:uncharacterized membrane protein YfcA
MELVGYLLTIIIGVSLGLIGGGGSILMVPLLAYLFNIDAVQSTSYSLFIVGATSLTGAYLNYRKGEIDIKTALLFGISSIATVFITRKFVLPVIPIHIATIGDTEITKQMLTMMLFALLMLSASASMIRSGRKQVIEANRIVKVHFSQLIIYGIGIGLVTGFLGAGGGFLLIPALVLIFKLPMKNAVGTSLLIIALNSLIGFTGDIGQFDIDWWFLIIMSALTVGGIIIGVRLVKYIPGHKLKTGFGWLVLIMGIYILIKEVLL